MRLTTSPDRSSAAPAGYVLHTRFGTEKGVEMRSGRSSRAEQSVGRQIILQRCYLVRRFDHDSSLLVNSAISRFGNLSPIVLHAFLPSNIPLQAVACSCSTNPSIQANKGRSTSYSQTIITSADRKPENTKLRFKSATCSPDYEHRLDSSPMCREVIHAKLPMKCRLTASS